MSKAKRSCMYALTALFIAAAMCVLAMNFADYATAGVLDQSQHGMSLNLGYDGDNLTLRVDGGETGYQYQFWVKEKIDVDAGADSLAKERYIWQMKKGYAEGGNSYIIGGVADKTAYFDELGLLNIIVRVKSGDDVIAELYGGYTAQEAEIPVITAITFDGKPVYDDYVVIDKASALNVKISGNIEGLTYSVTYNGTNLAQPNDSGEFEITAEDLSILDAGFNKITVAAGTAVKEISVYVVDEYVAEERPVIMSIEGVRDAVIEGRFNFVMKVRYADGSPIAQEDKNYFNFKLSWGKSKISPSAITANGNDLDVAFTVDYGAYKYGIYQMTGTVARKTINGYDDKIINYFDYKRPDSQPWLSLSAEGSFKKEEPVTLTANGQIPGGEGVQYAFYREDASGWTLIRNYSANPKMTWTPMRAGIYRIQARITDISGGSYEKEVIQTYAITGGGLSGDIEIKVLDIETKQDAPGNLIAGRPYILQTAYDGVEENILYMYTLTTANLGSVYLNKYSTSPEYIFVPGKADDYIFTARVISASNFGYKDKSESLGISSVLVDQTYIDYTVTFVLDNGQNSIVKTYHYGDTIEAPTGFTKEGHTFSGWDKEVTTCNGNETFTAQWSINKYSVTWKNYDGTTLRVDENVEYGTTPAFDGNTPSREDDRVYSYSFYSWDKVLSPVNADVTYTAVFTPCVKNGLAVNKVSTSNSENVILESSTVSEGANYTGPNTTGTINQSYLAFDGNYGYNDYFVADFTGKNLPNIAFFARNYNNSMYYADGSKLGVVVVSGLTTYNGTLYTTGNQSSAYDAKGLLICGPRMIYNTGSNSAGNKDVVLRTSNTASIGRANLVDGKKYRIIMGFVPGDDSRAIKLVYLLYSLTDNEVVEVFSLDTYNFFTNGWVEGMNRDDFCIGSIVAYGHFGTPTVLDKVFNIYEDTNVANIFKDLNMATDSQHGVVVKDDGNVVIASLNMSSYNIYNVKLESNGSVTLKSGSVGAGGNYTGPNANDLINLSYLAFDDDYGFDDYFVADFTGKNMPELAFFAQNYNNSMYFQNGNKKGIVVSSGITMYNGAINSILYGSTKVNVSGPYMAHIGNSAGAGVSGSIMSDFDSKLARANLADGKHYRIIIGFSRVSDKVIRLNYCLIDLDSEQIVEEKMLDSWGLFNNPSFYSESTDTLKGSVVAYGKFGTETKLDNVYGIIHGTFEEVKTSYGV
jgi:hypothetical protein